MIFNRFFWPCRGCVLPPTSYTRTTRSGLCLSRTYIDMFIHADMHTCLLAGTWYAAVPKLAPSYAARWVCRFGLFVTFFFSAVTFFMKNFPSARRPSNSICQCCCLIMGCFVLLRLSSLLSYPTPYPKVQAPLSKCLPSVKQLLETVVAVVVVVR